MHYSAGGTVVVRNRHSYFRGENSIAPPRQFVEQANVSDPSIYETFEQEWPGCWSRAAERLEWKRDYDTIVEQRDEPPYRQWFVDGRLNAAYPRDTAGDL